MASNGFDLVNLTKFRDVLQKALEEGEIDQFIRKTIHYIANRALGKIKKRTPVHDGLLRRNWKLGEITKTADGYLIEIYNNTHYASFVENGFRSHWVPGRWEGNIFVYDPSAKEGMQVGKRNGWVQGRFMMKLSMIEVERGLEAFLAKRQQQMLLELMKRAGLS